MLMKVIRMPAVKLASILLWTTLAAACGREQTNSDGNGTGNADGFGGRNDPPTAPSSGGRQMSDEGDASVGGEANPAPGPQSSESDAADE